MEKALAQNPNSCLKFVLFGPESTGKTTLAKQLSDHYNEPWVPEYMRTFLEKKWETSQKGIEKEDVLTIAKGQIASENVLSSKAKNLLLLDTNLLEIKTYCEYYYDDFCPIEIKNAAVAHKYDHYFLTGIDVPWEKDNLRDRPNDRAALFRIFENQLIKNAISYTLLLGSKENRLNKAITTIEEILNKH